MGLASLKIHLETSPQQWILCGEEHASTADIYDALFLRQLCLGDSEGA